MTHMSRDMSGCEPAELVSVPDDKTEGEQFCRSTLEQEELSCLERASQWTISGLETFFYRLGKLVAHHPIVTIFACLLLCGVCGIGLTKFQLTKDDADLWVPKASLLLPQKKWVEENFPENTRFVSVIITSPNVLSPWVLKTVLGVYLKSKNLTTTSGNTSEALCLRIGPNCFVRSILELWRYDQNTIQNLTLSTILEAVNRNTKYSPMYGTELNLEYMLSGIRRDPKGYILGAQALTINWILKNDPKMETEYLDWEKQMILAADIKSEFVIKSYVYATRSFDDEGYGAVAADTSLLTAGFITVFVFIIIVLGRFNFVENKVCVSLCGILAIGLAILFSYGSAIACGLMYGPIHALMPFLLLGVGVDDMFVIVSALSNLGEKQRKLAVEERIALALKNAGVSITVTSITDIVAFGIGASTVIPALSAFCGYAALGILGLYVLVSTFFVAVLTLDQHRMERNRNAILCCYVHTNYTPNRCSQINLVSTFIEKFYTPILMNSWVKILVVIVTCVLTSVNIWSFTMLEQDFDLYDYLPADSYATDYIKALQKYYPDKGYESAVYCGLMDYFETRVKMERLAWDMEHSPYIQNGSVQFWYPAFIDYIETTNNSVVKAQRQTGGNLLNRDSFEMLLPYFIGQREGRSFGEYLKFDSSTPPKLLAFKIPLIHTFQDTAAGDIDAMENLRSILNNIGFPGEGCFCYGFKYINNEANKILKGELYRNLALAAVCVFIVTLILIANLWTSILVFSCVVFTVIDVTGTLQFWGVTIEIASSILIILCVGLAVDYSAHVGHMFMTMVGKREDRAKATLVNIGPAVLNGGFSTFLAFVLLVDSKSYGFVLFFRVFVISVLFGLFHGLVYLPVLLSWIGPSSHQPNMSSSESLPVKHRLMSDTSNTQEPDDSQYLKLQKLGKSRNGPTPSKSYGKYVNGRLPFDLDSPESRGQESTTSICDNDVRQSDFPDGQYVSPKERCNTCQKVCTICVLEKMQQNIQEVIAEVRCDGQKNQGRCVSHQSMSVCDCDRGACNCKSDSVTSL